jgi:CpeT protein
MKYYCTMKKYFTFLLFWCSWVVVAKEKKEFSEKDLPKVYKMMQGFYSSAAQSKADTSYFDIRLKMVPIFTERKNEYWLYVEQAMSTSEDKPYRQRIYQLQWDAATNSVTSTVYTIKEGEKYYGAWQDAAKLAQIKMQDFELRKGCTIFLKKTKKGYAGSTHKSDCESNLRGAKYATSIVKIKKKKIVSWDQGFDANDKQVWGAVKGGYIFERIDATNTKAAKNKKAKSKKKSTKKSK